MRFAYYILPLSLLSPVLLLSSGARMIQPVFQALCVKSDIQTQQAANFFLGQFAAVRDYST